MHISLDDAPSYREWITWIALLTCRFRPFFSVPMSVAKAGVRLIAPVMNLGKARVFMYHEVTLAKMERCRVYSNAKAKRLLKWQPEFSGFAAMEATIRGHPSFPQRVTDPLSPLMLGLLLLLLLLFVWFLY